MGDISQLNLPMGAMGGQISGGKKTPKDVAGNLFKNILNGNSPHLSGAKEAPSLLGRKGSAKRSARDDAEDVSNPLDALDRKFRYLGVPMGQLRLPGTAAAKLVAFLEKKGFSREDGERLILSVTERDGMINLGRLMSRLQKEEPDIVQAEGSFFVESGDVPEVEAVLMKMGIDVGKIKEMIEKSVDSKGDLALNKLTGDLAKIMPGDMSKERLASILEDHGIKSGLKGIQGAFQDRELKEVLKGFSEAPSQDVQQKIKQDLGQLLQEKGVAPQEVKSFLENLSVQYSRSFLKGEDQFTSAARTEAAERETANVLNQVVITTRKGWGKGGLNEKIMDILKQENLIGKKDVNKDLRQEAPSLRLNSAELIKVGDEKAKNAHLQGMTAERGGGLPEVNTFGGKVTRETLDMKSSPDMKDAGGNNILSMREGKENYKVSSTNSPGNVNALPHPLPKIVDRMIWMIRGGEQRGSLHISPPELGKLDLDIVVKQGHLQANVTAENPVVKEIIEANMNQLKQQLADQGFIVEKFEVMVGLNDQRSRDGDTRTAGDRRGHSSKKAKMDVETAPVAAGVASNRTHDLNRIDVHV